MTKSSFMEYRTENGACVWTVVNSMASMLCIPLYIPRVPTTDRQHETSYKCLLLCNSKTWPHFFRQVWPPDQRPELKQLTVNIPYGSVTREGSRCLCCATWPRRPTSDITCQNRPRRVIRGRQSFTPWINRDSWTIGLKTEPVYEPL